MNCEICKVEIQTILLEKPLGTVVKDQKGKMHWVCSSCQGKYGCKEDLLKKIK